MSKELAHRLVRHSKILFFISLAAVLATISGFSNLSFSTDFKVFFDKTNPQLVAYEHIQNTFSKSDDIMFIVAAKNGDVFTPENLAAIEWLTEKSWQLNYSTRVESISNFQHTTVSDDDLHVENLVDGALTKSEAEIQTIKKIALAEPLLTHRLISLKGDVTAVDVKLELPDDQTFALRQLIPEARALLAEFQAKHPQFDTYLSGIAPFNHAFDEVGESDSTTLLPLMILVILVMVGILLRSVASTFITLTVIILGMVGTIGLVGLMQVQLNNVNSVAPVIILTLAVADCVHLLSHYLLGLRQGLSKQAAMSHSLDINLQAVFLTSFTTAIGFLSMNFSDSPPFRELGTIASIGVFFTFIFSITILPQLAMWLTRKTPKADFEHTKAFNKLADFTIAHYRKLIVSCLVVALGIMAFIPQNDLNDDNVNYFSQNLPVRQAADFAEKHLSSIGLIEYALDSGTENGVNNPEFLRSVKAFVDWYREQPEVVHVYTYTDIMLRLNKNMHGDDPSWHKLPESLELASQYSLLYEMSVPFGMDLNNQINIDKSALRITATLKNLKAKETLALEERAQAWLTQNAPNMVTPGASPSIMFAHIGQNNINSMIWGTVVATIIISLTLIFSLGSWRLGLLSIIPNAFPALITFGLWGAFVGEVNLAVAVIFSITLGIVVDDTVHFLAKYLRAKTEHKATTEEAIHYAFTHVGAALVTTTFVLATGFLMLALSDFAVNSTLGIMVSLTIVIALIFDFLFLPSLLLFFSRKKPALEKPQTDITNEQPTDGTQPTQTLAGTL